MKAFLCVAIGLLLCSLANAATFATRVSGDVATVQVDGEIVPGDVYRAALSLINVGAAKTIVFNLNSPGGNLGEATNLMKGIFALRLKGWHVNVAIDQGSECASACMLLFAAGERKFAFGKVSICVHQIRDGKVGTNYQDMTPDVAMTVNVASALRKLGAPLSVIGKQVLDDGSCTGLSDQELAEWGVVTGSAR